MPPLTQLVGQRFVELSQIQRKDVVVGGVGVVVVGGGVGGVGAAGVVVAVVVVVVVEWY